MTRAGTRKVKSGCRTCKERKIKCDESYPVCARCVSAGRTCSGYGIWGGGGAATQLARKEREATLPAKLNLLVGVGTEQMGYLEWFHLRTVTKIPGLFASPFWETVVLQASATEPVVLHASLALAAAHRHFQVDRRDHSDLLRLQAEDFMLRQYNKAIAHARDLLCRKDVASIQVVLIVCLLFTCLEYLRGHYSIASEHLTGGIKLLNDNVSRGKIDAGDKDDYVASALSDEFSRLNIQALTFGQRTWSKKGIVTPEPDLHVPDRFHSMSHARDALIRMLSMCCQLYAQSYLHRKSVSSATLAYLHRLKQTLEAKLAAWYCAFENSRNALEISAGAEGPIAYRMLRLYHTYATLALAPCLDPAGEMAFDSCMESFSTIIEQTSEVRTLVLSGHFNGTAHELRTDAAPFVVDMAGSAPLYYTAVKCRNLHLRMQAIEMLHDTKKREGVWDSNVAACVAREIVALEEASWQSASISRACLESDIVDLEERVMPREHRLCDTRVTLPNESTGDIILTCSWDRGDQQETFSRRFDQRQRSWSDVV